ncbi:MAG: HAD-IC family P-type ATPase, partial [Cyanobacteria bacterium J06642_3]
MNSRTSADSQNLNNQDWYTITPQQAVELLESNKISGLTSDRVIQKQRYFGKNELKQTGGRSKLSILRDQFTNVMLVMLIAIAIISAALDLIHSNFPKDSLAIFTIVILNGILGYFQESRAEKALAALKRLSSTYVKVIRDGVTQQLEAEELVPGDIMLLEAGIQIAADGRLLEEQNLQVIESTLTGEATAVSKDAKIILPEDTPLNDRLNLVFKGTQVVQGRAKAIIIKTGMDTEIGRIASMLQAVETDPTPLQQRMTQLGQVLVTGSLSLVVLITVGGLLKSGWQILSEILETSLSMAVAVVPEGLPAVVTVTLAIGTQKMIRRQALIRKLPAVETLGSVTTICSDKTGTLTQNKMLVQRVQTHSYDFEVTGNGYQPEGDFIIADCENVADQPEVEKLLEACVLCNDALLQCSRKSQGQAAEWSILGDPTEGALLTLAGKAGIFKEDLERKQPRLGEFAFTSERKRMSVIVEDPQTESSYLMFTKGSTELILEQCDRILIA